MRVWSSLSGLLNASIEMQYLKTLSWLYNVPSFALQFSNLLTFQVMELESVMWDIFIKSIRCECCCERKWICSGLLDWTYNILCLKLLCMYFDKSQYCWSTEHCLQKQYFLGSFKNLGHCFCIEFLLILSMIPRSLTGLISSICSFII